MMGVPIEDVTGKMITNMIPLTEDQLKENMEEEMNIEFMKKIM